jgi:hypothetical protein
MYIRQIFSALQPQAFIRSIYTGLDQSERQDLVLLQSVLKNTIYLLHNYLHIGAQKTLTVKVYVSVTFQKFECLCLKKNMLKFLIFMSH